MKASQVCSTQALKQILVTNQLQDVSKEAHLVYTPALCRTPLRVQVLLYP